MGIVWRPSWPLRSIARSATPSTPAVSCPTRADELVPRVLTGLAKAAAARGAEPKLHVTGAARRFVDDAWFEAVVPITRAGGPVEEQKAELIDGDRLGHEWEWEGSPEMTLHVVDEVATAVQEFNHQSPRFAASLVAEDEAEQEAFWASIDAPFVGDGFTRWVDGQYALDRPELGLSNWEFGRLFGRGGVLSGDSVFTLRARAFQARNDVHR